jgi:dienelactone hydrolase
MVERQDISFASDGGRCAGWLYPPPPSDSPGAPCVVMAHGFGAQKEARLDAYAERFAAAGFAALVFDYRHFGDSTGQPRQLVDIGRQHTDWQAAVAHARSLEGVDPERIALWGSSFSGGHVVWVAARDPQIAAVVSQVPHASGPATMRSTGAWRLARMTAAGIRDQIGALAGRAHYIPIVGPPGSLAAMTTDDAETRYRELYPAGFDFRNEVPARVLLRIGSYSPVRDARKVSCPLLVILLEADTITPPQPARRMAQRAPRGELHAFRGGHFEAYFGETFDSIVDLEIAFLHRALDRQAIRAPAQAPTSSS